MKKRELVYLHALLAEVRRFLDERAELPPRHFDAYEAHGVAPTAIHRTKGEHEEAVRLLGGGLVSALRDARSDESAEEASATPR